MSNNQCSSTHYFVFLIVFAYALITEGVYVEKEMFSYIVQKNVTRKGTLKSTDIP